MKFLELLAPARDINIGIAAIDCGADAVYIGGPAFGARQAAGNSIADLQKLCDYAHLFGARVFVTVNTILYDSELDEAERLLGELRRIGVDAVIAQDMALTAMCGHVSGGQGGKVLPLHASTQCSIRTPRKAAELEALGFSRLTLERELSLEQILRIASAVSCEVECFVHGAMCVCYSGQCYLSETLAGRSANRGECIQACRSRYDVTDKSGRVLLRDKAVLSLRDYNLKSRLWDLAEAGVTSFKIEGRLKNISYVRNTVREYSLALDELVSSSGGKYARVSFGKVRRGFTPDVNKTFNRGYTAFLMGRGSVDNGQERPSDRNISTQTVTSVSGRHTLGKVAAMDAAKGMGEEIGVVTDVAQDFRSFKILSRRSDTVGRFGGPAGKPVGFSGPARLANGDGLAFVAKNGEVVGLRADVCDGNKVKCKRIPELYNGAVIFRNYDTAFEKAMAANPCVRLLGATISARFTSPDSGTLTLIAVSEDGRRIEKTYQGLWNYIASNPERIRSMWTTQMSKSSGVFSFNAGPIESSGESLPLLSAAAMNSIRAEMARELSALDCRARPMYTAPATLSSAFGKDSPANPAADKNADKKSHPDPRVLTYKDNVANGLAEQVYLSAGFTVAERAYELTHRSGAELMRSKYCIRRELGLCPASAGKGSRQDPIADVRNGKGSSHDHIANVQSGKENYYDHHIEEVISGKESLRAGQKAADTLYLVNNGRRLKASFDCVRCEMALTSD